MLGAAIALFAMNTQAANVETELSAAHGYVETLDGKVGATGISIPGEDRDANGHPMNNRSLMPMPAQYITSIMPSVLLPTPSS